MIMLRSLQLLFRSIEIEILLQFVHEHGIRFLGGRLRLCFEYNEFHAVAEEIATETNVDGCFDAIAREDPEFYSSVCEVLYCVGDTVLETIFDCCATEELEFSFDFIGYCFKFGFSFVDCC